MSNQRRNVSWRLLVPTCRSSWVTCVSYTLMLFVWQSEACMRNKARSDLQMQCPADIERTAERRTSSAVVSWSREDFVVVSTNPVKGIYQTVPMYGASVSIRRTFGEGMHFIEYKAVDEAGLFARCSFYVSVQVVRCPAIFSPPNGVLTCDAGALYGSRCTVACIPGYSIGGEPADLECLPDRQWSNDVASCKLITCPDPGTPLNGMRACTTSTHAYGSVCSFSCESGYHLHGNDRLICGGSGDWLNELPTCEEIIPPKVVQCPSRPLVFTTSGSSVIVPRPPVMFSSGDGIVSSLAHTCTHYGDGATNQSFALGTHRVACTAVDRRYSDNAAVAECQFEIRVVANPCRSLPQPLNGVLLCSRTHGGGSEAVHDTTCQLFCHRGYVPARPVAGNQPTGGHYHCDNTGTWQPAAHVPSCVVPRRPHELKLPSELLYTSPCACIDESGLADIRLLFQAAVQHHVHLKGACSDGQSNCIVEEVVVDCRRDTSMEAVSHSRLCQVSTLSPSSTSSIRPEVARRRAGSRRSTDSASVPSQRRRVPTNKMFVTTTTTAGPHWSSDVPNRTLTNSGRIQSNGQRGQRRQRRDDVDREVAYVVSIQFYLSTRVPESGGSWPDEYHRASERLYAMFDGVDRWFDKQGGRFDEVASDGQPANHVDIEPIVDSLTSAHVRGVCDIGYELNMTTLLCVPCGAGSYYDVSTDRCALCKPGSYQHEQAQLECVSCPPGSTSIDEGATNLTQCIDIDECSSNPCLNNAVCEDRQASYFCHCQSPFAGKHCEERVFDCQTHSCVNGATCQPRGAHNYTCLCRASYFGPFCQFTTVDGGWSAWSEWTSCSQSCDGGVTMRNRSCDSPPPSQGGKQCSGATVEEKVCNLPPCPECKKLRRPYQGSIRCTTSPDDVNDTLLTCTISCQDGYTFSGQVLPNYTCGRRTSYLWPHESPDNPRALLPACTERIHPESATFEFRSSMSVPCPSKVSASELSLAVERQAGQLTDQLECMRDGTCALREPRVIGCQPSRPDDVTSRHRRRRVVRDVNTPAAVDVIVSMTYRWKRHDDVTRLQKDLLPTSTDKYVRTSQQIYALGNELLSRTRSGALYVELNGTRYNIDVTKTTATNSLICPVGAMPTNDGVLCGRCGPGSYFSTERRVCVLCDVGYFQPRSGQLDCIACPDEQVTYGRGAIHAIECYVNGSKIPVIPENYVESDTSRMRFVVMLTTTTFTSLVVASVVMVIVLIVRRKRRTAKYVVNVGCHPETNEQQIRLYTSPEWKD